MIRRPRAFLALIAASFVTAAPLAAPAQGPLALAPGQWPQAKTDVKADPSIRFGALPNGMRYAIRKQSIPPGQAALRLWIDAGSLMETDAQRGLAHFLEHMAFNGTKNVKEGEMIKMLERLGLAFGPDTNASTGFGETTYMLDLPRTNDETVDTALMLMREAASEITIDPAAVDRERGIVLSEERARDTPGYRILVQRLQFLMEGQRLPTRLPIGRVEVLKSAPASELAAFYKLWYRPDRTVLVAVGDFDVDAMEAKIQARFGDWKAAAPAAPEPPPGPVAPRKPEAKLLVEPGAPQSLQIAWVDEPDLTPDSVERRRRELIENLGLSVLNRRYSRITRAPNPPFLSAFAFESEQERAVRTATVAVNAERGRWKEALAAAEQEQRRAVRYGVRQDELDREIEEIRTNLRADVAGAATPRPQELAGEIVESLSGDTVVTAPADRLAYFEAAVKGLKAETVSAALKTVFRGQGPLVFLATPTPVEGGDAAVLAAFTGSQQMAVAPPAAAVEVAWPYESFGAPGKVAEARSVDDLGVRFFRFANNVRLTVKSTKFRDDEVLVRVHVGDGMLDLPSDRQSPYWASSAYIEGGLKKIDVEDMERVLASRLYGARFAIGDDAFTLSGGTRPEDLRVQLQVLAAYVVEPGWRESAFLRVKSAGKTIHDQYESTDNGILARDLPAILHSGDRRWTFPTREEIAAAKLEDIARPITEHMAQGPIEIIVVGDVTPEAVRDAVATTFGALPRRPDRAAGKAAPVPFAQGRPEPVVLTHKGRADQSVGYIAWPTADYWADPQRARETALLGEIMRLRLNDELREAQGSTYSPDVAYTASLVWPGWGYLAASVEVPPAKLDGFFADAKKIAADLAANEVTADELARAKAPRLERLQRSQLTNSYWLNELAGSQTDPRHLDRIRQSVPGTQKVTVADIRRVAQTWLKPAGAFKLVAKPVSEAQAAASASP